MTIFFILTATVVPILIGTIYFAFSTKWKLLKNEELLAQLNQELSQSKQQLKNLIDNFDIALWTYADSSHRIPFTSEGLAKITGYPSDYFGDQNAWKNIIHPDDVQLFEKLCLNLRQGNSDISEYRIIHSSGDIRWIQSRILPTMDNSNGMIGLNGEVIDITSKRKMEEDLLRSEQKYKSLFEFNSDVICEMDLTGKIISINRAAENITGQKFSDLGINVSWINIFGESGEKVTFDHFEKAKQGQPQKYKMISFHSDQKAVYWDIHIVPIVVNKEIAGVFSICKDVSSEIIIRNALTESEAKYRFIAENMADFMGVVDLHGVIQYACPTYEKVLGYDSDSMVGTSAFDYIYPDDINDVKKLLFEMVKTGATTPGRFRYIHADGHQVFVDCLSTPVLDVNGNVDSIIVVARNITEKIQFEKELKLSEERYRRLIELSPQPMASHRDGKIIYINPAGVQLMGALKPDEVVGKKIFDLVHPDYVEIARNRVQLVFDQKYAGSLEYKIIRLDGKVIEVEITGIYDSETKSNLIVFTDITERKKMERALLESEERYRRLVELSPIAISIFKNNKFVYVNPTAMKVIGVVRPEEVLGTVPLDWVYSKDRVIAEEMMETTLHKGHSSLGEYRIIRKDGEIVDVSVTCIYDTQSTSVQLVFEDITAQKKAKHVLLESENRYFRLQTSLDRFSHDLFGVMKVSELEKRLINEVQEILQVKNVNVFEIDQNNELIKKNQNIAKTLVDDISVLDIKSLPISEIIDTQDGYIIKIGTSKGKTYLLSIGEKTHLLKITSKCVWLKTIARYVSVLFDNFRVIEDLTNEIQQNTLNQIAPSWLLRLLFNISENERKRLSQDLHDAALQEQIIWYRKLEQLTTDKTVPPTIRAELDQIAQGLLDVIYQIRITCNELRPPMLIEDGLVYSLEALFELTQIRANYSIQFDTTNFLHCLNDELLIGLYRIVQELLANATKHSNATSVGITLFSHPDRILLIYEDNGIGMQISEIENSFKSMGVYGMKERVRSLDGEIEFHSSANIGLGIFISIPSLLNDAGSRQHERSYLP
ncbi:PAS domain-containing sensor histidine kinase [Brevibacillus centrosporus]|uniref:PAS domain-containing sensor histidine kinase n=1 Tax=Brevibacillus centrosporus TaxID=54910 RepID=UPI003B01E513